MEDADVVLGNEESTDWGPVRPRGGSDGNFGGVNRSAAFVVVESDTCTLGWGSEPDVGVGFDEDVEVNSAGG